MTYCANIEINLLFLFLLFILFINKYRRKETLLFDQKLFLYLIAANALLLILDMMQWGLDGVSGTFMRNVNIITNMLYYICSAVPCVLWCLYVRYQFSINEKETMKASAFLAGPFILNTVLAVMSCFSGQYFYFDENNFYHRGVLFWIYVAINFGFIIYAQLFVVFNRKKIEKSRYFSLLLFALPPLVGGSIQTFFYGVTLIWPCMALSLLIIYLNIQNNQLYTDHLTGLYNRRLLDLYLDGCLKKNVRGGSVGSIMLDIDEFKTINDKLGHTMGDQALVNAAEIMKKSIGKDKFIARYGGDEFVIIFDSEDVPDIGRMVDDINHNVEQYNRQNRGPYQLKFSMGYDWFECGSGLTKEAVLDRIDSLMYENKRKCRA
ncbi:hypothetical protein SDC9_71738 [bioreactor metagenome]|uniref:GGDEF domain-containing protein n=1 Tax=bioreactor metagenome TaxID=1076179 RepID=A0A644YBB5_9ZZZZ